jgi:hypothetical protein
MPMTDSQPFAIEALPAELRTIIYQFALLSDQREHWIWRKNLPNLRTMRFRYNQPSRMFQDRCLLSDDAACKDPGCRTRDGIDGHVVEPIDLKGYAFGLFYTSRTVSEEARTVFYGQIHFIFDNRFDLHIFLRSLGRTAKFVKSVTFSWLKSNGPHSQEIKQEFKGWSLRSETCYGPELSTSIQELTDACPRLEFLEMIALDSNLPTKDAKELRDQPYQQWTIVKRICELHLKGFRYPTWSLPETTDEALNSFRRQQATLRAEIEDHVNTRGRIRTLSQSCTIRH